ncbi:VOC family protein [Brevibacterium sp. UCMA 11754]|uniref:VOC family protein n=1 Tax=Brevibacterium sp. UCMA 11754 TaxID=2749198 RepID=UPI001F20559B|nr:VOC family protein [Brevibacterium sp. UCMA 11754]MCF2571199.1 VOC family protein [Brevibacterium sp. UCMA 11754]MCF2571201.1 VOC family protein [Brevibacterium sp. UCMA 11754]
MNVTENTTATDTVSPVVNDTLLSAATGMDAVTLRVGDLEKMSTYYSNALAMEPLEEVSRGSEIHRVLGRGVTPLVKLVAIPNLPGVDHTQAGLFHTAFLFENQASLAATVAHAAQNTNSQFVGSSDHLVSEAFYFTDPESNGIELYVDRDRSEWKHSADGEVRMDTIYLDPNAFLAEHLDEQTLAQANTLPGIIGHVHLQVGDVPTAHQFYVDALGFEPTLASMPGVLFASAGGYHHHVAMNTWNSRGVGPRAASLGLGDVAITVPGREDLDALVARLSAHKMDFADDGRSVRVSDPWGTQVTLGIGGSSIDQTLTR